MESIKKSTAQAVKFNHLGHWSRFYQLLGWLQKCSKNRYMIKHVTHDMNILNYMARIVVNSLPAKRDV